MTEFGLQGDFIELYKLLKLMLPGVSGGQAKGLIAEGQVRLNGELCLEKRKKIRAGDQVSLQGQTIEVIHEP